MSCNLDWDHLRSLQKSTVMRRTVKQASGPSSTWYGESLSSMGFAVIAACVCHVSASWITSHQQHCLHLLWHCSAPVSMFKCTLVTRAAHELIASFIDRSGQAQVAGSSVRRRRPFIPERRACRRLRVKHVVCCTLGLLSCCRIFPADTSAGPRPALHARCGSCHNCARTGGTQPACLPTCRRSSATGRLRSSTAAGRCWAHWAASPPSCWPGYEHSRCAVCSDTYRAESCGLHDGDADYTLVLTLLVLPCRTVCSSRSRCGSRQAARSSTAMA